MARMGWDGDLLIPVPPHRLLWADVRGWCADAILVSVAQRVNSRPGGVSMSQPGDHSPDGARSDLPAGQPEDQAAEQVVDHDAAAADAVPAQKDASAQHDVSAEQAALVQKTGPAAQQRPWWRRIVPSLSRSIRLVVLAVSLLVVVLMIGGSLWSSQETNRPGANTAAIPSSGISNSASDGNSASNNNSVSTDSRAFSQLVSNADAGWAATQPVNGQWVAELAEAVVVSPGQSTPLPSGAGASTTAPAALTSFESLQAEDAGQGYQLRLLRRSAYGPASVDDQFTFVTVVAGPFSNADTVRSWCAAHAGALTTQRCDPVQLRAR